MGYNKGVGTNNVNVVTVAMFHIEVAAPSPATNDVIRSSGEGQTSVQTTQYRPGRGSRLSWHCQCLEERSLSDFYIKHFIFVTSEFTQTVG